MVPSLVKTLTYPVEQSTLEKPPSLHLLKKFPVFMEHESLLPHSQLPAICPYDESQIYPVHTTTSHFLKIHFNIILPFLV